VETVKIALSFVVVQLGQLVIFVSGPVVWMVMLFGSSSHCPPAPRVAPASTTPTACRVSRPLVSTNPPLPPLMPPRAKIDPAKLVFCPHQTMPAPESPLLSADTSILVVLSIATVFADATGARVPKRPR